MFVGKLFFLKKISDALLNVLNTSFPFTSESIYFALVSCLENIVQLIDIFLLSLFITSEDSLLCSSWALIFYSYSPHFANKFHPNQKFMFFKQSNLNFECIESAHWWWWWLAVTIQAFTSNILCILLPCHSTDYYQFNSIAKFNLIMVKSLISVYIFSWPVHLNAPHT